mmetsp:Transcript_132318/g.382537  ORF Transcript_132318/g.382537 Transcript_132318/m.382537 type:complete len:324 (-) Transcript_132318:93-1064(-)
MSTWDFRPSVLSLVDEYREAKLPRSTFLEHYQRDNQRAADGFRQVPSKSGKFRTLQWNLNGWAGDSGTLNALTYSKQITAAILQADADCIILNEYHWNDAGLAHQDLERVLKSNGYTTQVCGTVICPTFVATRWNTSHKQEWILSQERSALVLKLDSNEDDGESLTVIGTHLDHRFGEQRLDEMTALMNNLFHQQSNPQDENHAGELEQVQTDTKIILAGDLNQQRQKDYPPEEWQSVIAPSMAVRKTCCDDGVDSVLQSKGFCCAWDDEDVVKNWSTEYPPSTHWSGTVVDYSYGRNVAARKVFISPAGWSDHRMTVVDWSW